MNELRALTGARGIAAWLVVLFHLRLSLSGVPAPVMAVLAKGYLAVDFFFLLSGFVIWLAWHDRFAKDGLRVVPEFLCKRVARVWPLHLFVLAGAVLLAGALSLSGRDVSAEFPLAALPLHVVLLQSWGSAHTLAWNDPAWSISAEFAAYLLFPLLACAIDWRRWPVAGLLAVVAGLIALLAGGLALAGESGLGRDIPRFALLRCTTEFAGGTVLAALFLRWQGRGAPWAWLVTALAFAGFVTGNVRESVAMPVAFSALLLALALGAGRPGHPLEGRAVHWLGEVSYATYLCHYLVWFVFKLLFVADVTAAPWVVVAGYVASVVILSGMLYAWVERPAQRWLNRTRRTPGIAA